MSEANRSTSNEGPPPDPFDNDQPEYWAELDAQFEAKFLARRARRKAAKRESDLHAWPMLPAI